MASRDYLIRQIEEMGLFLSILLKRILKLKEENQQDQMQSVVVDAFRDKTGLDIDQIVLLENADFLEVVKLHFTSEDQLTKLADILRVLGMQIEQSFTLSRLNYLQKSLVLYSWLQENSTNYSYERRANMLEIQKLLFSIKSLNESWQNTVL